MRGEGRRDGGGKEGDVSRSDVPAGRGEICLFSNGYRHVIAILYSVLV